MRIGQPGNACTSCATRTSRVSNTADGQSHGAPALCTISQFFGIGTLRSRRYAENAIASAVSVTMVSTAAAEIAAAPSGILFWSLIKIGHGRRLQTSCSGGSSCQKAGRRVITTRGANARSDSSQDDQSHSNERGNICSSASRGSKLAGKRRQFSLGICGASVSRI